MARKVKMNIQGLREVLKSSETQAVLRSHAEKSAAAARASAPVDSGEYRDSIDVETRVHRHVAVARVVAHASHSMVVEAKTGNLARSLR